MKVFRLKLRPDEFAVVVIAAAIVGMFALLAIAAISWMIETL